MLAEERDKETTMKALIMDDKAIERAITRISHEIIEKNKGVENLAVVGIKTRGIYLAERIAQKITEIERIAVPHYAIDITSYRDDLEQTFKTQIDNNQNIIIDLRETAESIKEDIEFKNKKIVLVDDVLYTGRTIRAALNAILGFGRPSSIQLAVLIDRGHRELPIRADYVGKNVPTSTDEKVKVYIQPYDSKSEVVIY